MQKRGRKKNDVLPWEELPHVWKTKSSFYSWLRGGIRRGLWNRHPCKVAFLKENTIMIANDNPRSSKRFPKVKGAVCNICKGEFKMAETQVDHIDGHHSLSSKEDIHNFIESIVFVSMDDLQILCLDCHKTKSLSDSRGISFDEAKAERMAIKIVKEKKDKQWLIDNGIEPASNQKLRREQIVREIVNVQGRSGCTD